jgi:hypothetical protein
MSNKEQIAIASMSAVIAAQEVVTAWVQEEDLKASMAELIKYLSEYTYIRKNYVPEEEPTHD